MNALTFKYCVLNFLNISLFNNSNPERIITDYIKTAMGLLLIDADSTLDRMKYANNMDVKCPKYDKRYITVLIVL